MSRAAGLAKVGFYATPPEALRRLCALLTPAPGVGHIRVLDPCAGEGDALAAVTSALDGEPFAAEVQRDRAALCRERFTNAIWGDAFRLRLSHHAFSLLWLNPPYDRQAAAKGGYELKFLRELDRAIAPGGVLVYLIPRDRLAAASTYLSGHFQDIEVWRFTDDEYQPFKQVAVVARKRPTFIKDSDTQLRLMRYGAGWGSDDLPVLPEPGELTIEVPRLDDVSDLLFASADIDTDALLALLNGKSAVWAHSVVQQKLWPSATYRARPLMPLRQGHLALLLAAGYLDNAVIPTPAGRLLVKGRISKDVVVVSVDEDAGKRVERERLNVALTALNADTGELRTYEGDGLGEFASQFRRELTEAVVRTFPAIYTVDHRSAMPLDRLKRRPMGAQADVIRALAVSVKRRPGTICVGIPGTGKTYVASAVALLAGCVRTLIMCPPHLTRKWCREIEMTVPNARAMILRTPADLDNAMTLPASPSRPLFLVCSRETAKLGYRSRPAAIWRKLRIVTASGSSVTVERLCCPDCLGQLEDRDGKPLDAADLRGHKAKHLCAHCREMGGHQQECRICWPDQPEGVPRLPCRQCCGGVLYTADSAGPRRQEIARYLAKRYRGQIDLFVCDEVHECKAGSTAQGRAMGVFAAACKRSLALSGTLYSGYASGIFYLLFRLLPEFRREFRYEDETRFIEKYGIFEMTYTKTEDHSAAGSRDLDDQTGIVSKRGGERMTRREKPGMSPALLLHVIECSAFLRLEDLAASLPAYDEQVQVIPMDEPLEPTYRQLERDYADAARRAGFGRKLAVMGSMVQNCLSYPDTCAQPLEATLKSQGEVWERISAPALAFGLVYPKEQALLDLVQAEKRRGRRVMVYYTNTHSRDLAPRLLSLLERGGLRTKVLTVDVRPEQRESWIERKVKAGLDALLINPQLVETGLDLLDFPTIAWFQVNYRTTTVRQASRRSWRIGQRLPVVVHHLVYASSVQTAALNLIARKVHSSNLFDGDLSAGGLDEMVEDESLVALAKQLLDRALPQDGALEQLFANREQTVSAEDAFIDASFTEEFTAMAAVSPVIAIGAAEPRPLQAVFGSDQAENLTRLIEEHERLRADELERARELAARRREALVSAGQLVLFPEAA